jgi:acetyl/propionyl-CoA carboxylase alpha subunit
VKNGQQEIAGPGRHFLGWNTKWDGSAIALNQKHIHHKNITIATIPQGQIGIAIDNNRPVVMLPGRHAFNSSLFVFKGDGSLFSLNQPVIKQCGIAIITIKSNQVGLAYFKKTGKSHAVEVKVQQVQVENIKRSILASGTLVYKNQVQLRSEVIGQVQQVLIEEGDDVTQGQVLMRLEPRTFKADVELQQAHVRISTIAIERQKKQIENLQSQWQRKSDL